MKCICIEKKDVSKEKFIMVIFLKLCFIPGIGEGSFILTVHSDLFSRCTILQCTIHNEILLFAEMFSFYCKYQFYISLINLFWRIFSELQRILIEKQWTSEFLLGCKVTSKFFKIMCFRSIYLNVTLLL